MLLSNIRVPQGDCRLFASVLCGCAGVSLAHRQVLRLLRWFDGKTRPAKLETLIRFTEDLI
jgi:hypothetical protein